MSNVTTGPDISVDRGQPVIVTVNFCDGDPDEVYFSFTQPDEARPHTDDGFGQPQSHITKLGEGIYRYVIHTRDFAAGFGDWHCWAEWHAPTHEGYSQASIRGKYEIKKAPAQLL